ncbi:MAG: peroxiredoxin [Candidatus Bathyarchaeia archaeon]|jgi:peroxiredoxin|nr:peroxiredoxin [Candidatus Bathyarchaeota archaeon]
MMETKIKIGQKAPDFTLTGTDMKPHGLKDYLSQNVVLAFFPGAFTSVCTKEMCTFRDALARLNSLKAQVIGISVNDPFANKAFAEKNLLNFPLLCDYNREVVKLYDVAMTDFAGLKGYTVAKRSIFIIDKKGIVRYVWVSENPALEPNYQEIEKTLEQIAKT